MAGRRGSIQRRTPNPARKLPEKERVQRGGAPMFHDAGRVSIPTNSRVTVFQRRFPCVGDVREATMRLRNVPEGSVVVVHVIINGEDVFEQTWDSRTQLLRFPKSIVVDEYTFFVVQLSTADEIDPISVDADIAYLFQDRPRAKVQPPVR